MTLIEKIIAIYPSLATFDFASGVITVVNDEDGERISVWDHPELPTPTADQLGNVEEPVVLPPSQVTAAQGGIALIQAGLMDSVQQVADAQETPAEVKWAWQRAQDWQRDSAALAYLSQRAGISDEQMDDLFIAAIQIQA